MSAIEIAAVVVTLLSVTLTVRQNIWCWPTAIIGVALYTVVFFRAKLYADMGLQVVYVLLSVYGWYQWLHGGKDRSELPVSRASNAVRSLSALAGLAAFLTLGVFLRRTTDAALPFADSALTSFSLVAQWQMTKKYLDNWIVWIAVDVFYVWMFTFKGLYLTAGLYVVFIALCIMGYREWKRTMPKNFQT